MVETSCQFKRKTKIGIQHGFIGYIIHHPRLLKRHFLLLYSFINKDKTDKIPNTSPYAHGKGYSPAK